MTVTVQPALEGQVKIYGAEVERTKLACKHLKMSVDQFIAYAIQHLVQEILADEKDFQELSLKQFQEGLDNPEDAVYDKAEQFFYTPNVRPEVKRLRELLAKSDETDEQEQAALDAELANYKPLSEEESLALAKRLSEGGLSSLDILKEREEGW